MAKILHTNYTFSPNAGTIILNSLTLQREQLLSIVNTTKNVIIYDSSSTPNGGSFLSVSSAGGNTTITLAFSVVVHDSSDRLQIFYDDASTGGSSPLPTGAATETTLAAINNKILSLSFIRYRNTALSSTPQQVKASGATLLGWNFINSNTVTVYVKLYDALLANVTVGTTTPVKTIAIPPGDGTNPGIFYMAIQGYPQELITTGLTIACVTGLADSSTAAPATAIHASLRYI